MAKERMFSTSIQLSESQFDRVELIKKTTNAQSNAEVLRTAFDFYVKAKHPEVLEETK